jgi:hypothetical protein
MHARHVAMGGAEIGQPQQIFLFVEHKAGEPRDVFGACACFPNERDDIGERLLQVTP